MLSVIIPAYNEAKRLDKIIQKIISTLETCSPEYEVIIVNDGSHDGTYEEVLSIATKYPNVKALSYKKNMGKGYALKYGFQFTCGDLILFLDADLDLPPFQVSLFLDYMSKSDADIIIGSKRHHSSKVDFPLSRRILSKGFNLLVRILLNLNISDTQVGMKLFQREVLEQVFSKVSVKRYAFDVELLVSAIRSGYRIVEVPVTLNFGHDSKINLKAIEHIFVDTLYIFYRMKILHYYDKGW